MLAVSDTLNWRSHIFGYSWDILPFYERLANELPDQARIVEVGVLYGRSVLFLAERMEQLGKHPEMTAVDSWSWAQHPASYDRFMAHRDEVPGGHAVWPLRLASLDAALQFEDHSLDLVFVDGDHSEEAVRADLEAWTPKVKPGGLISGHDYHRDEDPHVGVRRAVDKFYGVGKVQVEASVWSVRL